MTYADDAARHEAELVAAFLPCGHSAQLTVHRSDERITRIVTTYDERRRRVGEHVFADPLRRPHFGDVLNGATDGALDVVTMRVEADDEYDWMSEGHGHGRMEAR